jgi:hypothetical protein
MRMMKVNPERLAQHLAGVGYERGFPTLVLPSCSFVRRSSIFGLYESIIVSAGGKESEAVAAEVGVSMTKVVMYKRLGAVRLVKEVAEMVERGQTIIRSREKATEWEHNLAAIAPTLNRAWAEAQGPAVLSRTRGACLVIDDCVRRLDLNKPRNELLMDLRSGMDEQSQELASRMFILGGPGPRGISEIYELACLALARFAPAVAPDPTAPLTLNPQELVDRIALLADRLLPDSGK